jgi:sec-independent protein translocase protein TatA
MFGLGTGEVLLILVVLVVLFGAKKIPELGESLGKGIRSFRKATDTGVIDVTPEKKTGKAPEAGASAPTHGDGKNG